MARRLIFGVVLLFLTACGGAAGSATTAANGGGSDTGGSAGYEAQAGPASSAGAQPEAEQARVDVAGQQSQAQPNAQAPGQRLVIKTATLQMVVDDVSAAEQLVRKLADTREGFVLSSQASGENDRRTATIAFKVPAQRFDEALTELSKFGKIEAQNVQGQDVTDEFVDLQSRLKNLRAVETRLLQFLADAKTTKEALDVNAQLSDIQGQIEQAQGRITYLQQSAALSTITVTLRAAAVVSIVPEAGWAPGATARNALNSLITFGQGLADIAIVVAVWAPVWLPLFLIGWWFVRRGRRLSAAPLDSSAGQP